jgi:hypothetical protein
VLVREPNPGVSFGPAATVSADLDGRYEIRNVRPGDYRLSAGKPGYLPLEYGQQRSFEPGRIVSVSAGQTLEGLDIALPPSGAISGRVTDANGDPVEAVVVRLLQVQFTENRRQLSAVPGVASRSTNDEGSYRFFGVPPGDFIVMAAITGATQTTPNPNVSPDPLTGRAQLSLILPPGYGSTYYPGTPTPSAARYVRVGLSQQVAGMDFSLARTSVARLSGVVVDSSGAPRAATITLSGSRRAGTPVVESVGSTSAPDGRFELRQVPPGEWVLRVMSRPPSAEFASQFIAVNGTDITDLRVQTSPGSRVNGRFVFEGTIAPPTGPELSSLRAVALPMDFDLSQGTSQSARSDGTFALDGLHGPRRLALLRTATTWSLKAVRANGRDVTDVALPFGRAQDSLTDVEIVLTNVSARIGGRVNDAQGRSVAGYVALVFATEREQWYQSSRFLRFASSRVDGTFGVGDLPAGEYFVAAVDWMRGNDTSGEWLDPDFLQSITSRATRVTLGEGQQLSVTPRLIIR